MQIAEGRFARRGSFFIRSSFLFVTACLLLCCGCQLIGRERPVPKQMAASRNLSQRGISELERGEWDKGEALLAQAIKACPTDAEPHRHYAEALWHRGAREEGLAQMREAMRFSGDDPNLAVRVGEMCFDLGRQDEAAKLADDAIDLSPRLASAWALRGEIAQAKGQLDEALADLHRGLEFQHDDKRLLLLTAELYRQQGRPERALGVLEALRDCYGTGEEPQQILYLQGLAFAALARYDDAVEAYRLGLQRDRPSAELYFRLAEAHLRAGRPAEAGGAIQQALALDPNHQPSRALAEQAAMAQRGPADAVRR
ncbi:MAG TPA: tetratricopeptide repeat protein [Pirellulales bacterium]|jgi:tetratricopeptide (TPR) repeat protein|nr:tetratricopeptide repeat protein [Pirellulales bacterium]